MRWFLLGLFGAVLMQAGFAQPVQAQPAQSQPAQEQQTPTPPAPAQPAAQAPPPAPAQPPAQAQAAPAIVGPVYAVTYFETAPAAVRKTNAMLRQFSAATRKENGNTELTVLHEIGRPGRFAIVEAWRDKAAFDAHGAAMKALGGQLQPAFASPFEQRVFGSLSIGATPAASTGEAAGAVYVVTHVDVFPPGKDEAAALVKTLAEDSHKDAGVQRFDAVIMEGRPNHFHLIEVWSDRNARAAHVLADHTKQFRAKVTPLEGALYDERLYEVVKKTD